MNKYGLISVSQLLMIIVAFGGLIGGINLA